VDLATAEHDPILYCFNVGFEEGKVPSEEYKARALPKLEERMALGGRRLAELIKDIYGNSTALFLQ